MRHNIYRWFASLLAFATILFALSGCVTTIVAAPPPVVVVVPGAPPPPPPPGAWISGHYEWDGRAWIWIPGHWR